MMKAKVSEREMEEREIKRDTERLSSSSKKMYVCSSYIQSSCLEYC